MHSPRLHTHTAIKAGTHKGRDVMAIDLGGCHDFGCKEAQAGSSVIPTVRILGMALHRGMLPPPWETYDFTQLQLKPPSANPSSKLVR